MKKIVGMFLVCGLDELFFKFSVFCGDILLYWDFVNKINMVFLEFIKDFSFFLI